MENHKTQDVVRLAYSRPPPEWVESGVVTVGGQTYPAVEEPGGRARRRPLQYAWIHYKNENDPPGGEIVGHSEGWAFGFLDQDNEAIGSYHMPHEARAASWAWYDRRLALWEELHSGVWCPACRSDDAYTEDLGDGTYSQPRCTECDVEMGDLFDDQWPEMLAWSDDQVVVVERWLSDSTSAMPEVLRA